MTPGGTPASWKHLTRPIGEPGVSSGHLMMIEQPAASDAAILRTACVTGKFQGAKPATGPIGSMITMLRTPSARAGMMRP